MRRRQYNCGMAAEPQASAPPPADRDHQVLRDLLADRDIACERCGYNLRGVTAGECPECGAALRLPDSLTSLRGYGPGSILVWVFPLVWVLLGTIFNAIIYIRVGAGLGAAFDLGTIVLLGAMLPVLAGLIAAVAHRRRLHTARRRVIYWMYARAVIALCCLATLASFLFVVAD